MLVSYFNQQLVYLLAEYLQSLVDRFEEGLLIACVGNSAGGVAGETYSGYFMVELISLFMQVIIFLVASGCIGNHLAFQHVNLGEEYLDFMYLFRLIESQFLNKLLLLLDVHLIVRNSIFKHQTFSLVLLEAIHFFRDIVVFSYHLVEFGLMLSYHLI